MLYVVFIYKTNGMKTAAAESPFKGMKMDSLAQSLKGGYHSNHPPPNPRKYAVAFRSK